MKNIKNVLLGLAFVIPAATVFAFGSAAMKPKVAFADCNGGTCSNANLVGDYAFDGEGLNDSQAPAGYAIGLLQADGIDSFTGKMTSVGSANPLDVQSFFCLNGNYSINSDGTGTMTINAYVGSSTCSGPYATMTADLVLGTDGHSFRAVTTSGDSPILLRGHQQ